MDEMTVRDLGKIGEFGYGIQTLLAKIYCVIIGKSPRCGKIAGLRG
jgi:hypothetical protein